MLLRPREIYLGGDPGNEDLGELAAAEELLTNVRPYVHAFDTTQHLSDSRKRRDLRFAQLERIDASSAGPWAHLPRRR